MQDWPNLDTASLCGTCCQSQQDILAKSQSLQRKRAMCQAWWRISGGQPHLISTVEQALLSADTKAHAKVLVGAAAHAEALADAKVHEKALADAKAHAQALVDSAVQAKALIDAAAHAKVASAWNTKTDLSSSDVKFLKSFSTDVTTRFSTLK